MEKEETQLEQHQDTLLQTGKSHNYASSQVCITSFETQVVTYQYTYQCTYSLKTSPI